MFDNPNFEHVIAEKIDPIIVSIADKYSHIFAPATTFGKNIMPRVAVKLDVAQISDVISVESEDTFIRPIYAGNLTSLISSTEHIKFLTIRPTKFSNKIISVKSQYKIKYNDLIRSCSIGLSTVMLRKKIKSIFLPYPYIYHRYI